MNWTNFGLWLRNRSDCRDLIWIEWIWTDLVYCVWFRSYICVVIFNSVGFGFLSVVQLRTLVLIWIWLDFVFSMSFGCGSVSTIWSGWTAVANCWLDRTWFILWFRFDCIILLSLLAAVKTRPYPATPPLPCRQANDSFYDAPLSTLFFSGFWIEGSILSWSANTAFAIQTPLHSVRFVFFAGKLSVSHGVLGVEHRILAERRLRRRLLRQALNIRVFEDEKEVFLTYFRQGKIIYGSPYLAAGNNKPRQPLPSPFRMTYHDIWTYYV